MKRFCILFGFLITGFSVGAEEQCLVDLNGDGACDTYEIAPVSGDTGESRIKITTGGTNKVVEGIFNLGNGGISTGYFPAEFSVLLDFYTRNTSLTKYDFRWKKDLEDWVLYKTSSWTEASRDEIYALTDEAIPPEAIFPTDIDIKHVECCIRFTDFSIQEPSIRVVPDHSRRLRIRSDFKVIQGNLVQGADGSLFKLLDRHGNLEPRSIPVDFVHELADILDAGNVREINDYAYYLYLNDNSMLAAMLLKQIHNKFPSRVAATLNLADAYWAVGMKSLACPLYAEYEKKMTQDEKQARIPAHVRLRTACN